MTIDKMLDLGIDCDYYPKSMKCKDCSYAIWHEFEDGE
jgi:hypothetical protein